MTPAEARARIQEHSDLHAFISLTQEDGTGPVVAVKDLVDVKGTITTAGSAFLDGPPAEDDAPLIKRMRRSGCIVIGKANLHEWAFGVTSTNPHFGAVRNPHDPERVAGGSSGGSAVAVATCMCDWAVGSDTGGSIRIPASFCGVAGIKPTVGTVDVTGVVPLSPSLDTIGTLAPDVAGAARALEMMSELGGLVTPAPRPLAELRVAIAGGWGEGLERDVAEAWERVTAGLPRIALPDREWMGASGLTILYAEAAAYHRSRLERSPERFGADVRELLERGLTITRQNYVGALLDQSRIRLEMEAAMEGWDAVLAPVTRIGPPRIGETYHRADLTGYTRPFNTSGQPVVVLPAPTRGMPVGIQVVGHFGADAAVIEVGLVLERAWREIAA